MRAGSGSGQAYVKPQDKESKIMMLALNVIYFAADKENKGNLLVRARDRKHLESILGNKVEIQNTPQWDFPFRTSVPKTHLAKAISSRILDTSYSEFKDAGADDDRLHETVWDLWRADAE
jgi:hypothetical protein